MSGRSEPPQLSPYGNSRSAERWPEVGLCYLGRDGDDPSEGSIKGRAIILEALLVADHLNNPWIDLSGTCGYPDGTRRIESGIGDDVIPRHLPLYPRFALTIG